MAGHVVYEDSSRAEGPPAESWSLTLLELSVRRLPELSCHLQLLRLFGCDRLREIVLPLPQLLRFEAINCTKLRRVLLQTPNLTGLRLGCPKLHVPDLPTKLEKLVYEGPHRRLGTLPSSLRRLSLYACPRLQQIGPLPELKKLALLACPKLPLPPLSDSIETLTLKGHNPTVFPRMLKHLYLESAPGLQILPALPVRTKKVVLCSNLQLTSVGLLNCRLQKFYCSDSPLLTEFIFAGTVMEKVIFWDCPLLQVVASRRNLSCHLTANDDCRGLYCRPEGLRPNTATFPSLRRLAAVSLLRRGLPLLLTRDPDLYPSLATLHPCHVCQQYSQITILEYSRSRGWRRVTTWCPTHWHQEYSPLPLS